MICATRRMHPHLWTDDSSLCIISTVVLGPPWASHPPGRWDNLLCNLLSTRQVEKCSSFPWHNLPGTSGVSSLQRAAHPLWQQGSPREWQWPLTSTSARLRLKGRNTARRFSPAIFNKRSSESLHEKESSTTAHFFVKSKCNSFACTSVFGFSVHLPNSQEKSGNFGAILHRSSLLANLGFFWKFRPLFSFAGPHSHLFTQVWWL